MIYFPATTIDSITEKDIKDFLSKEHRENRFLDYKLKYNIEDKKDTKEFLKDVTAFANSQGGNLIIGVEEIKKGDITIPGKLIGIEDGASFAGRCRDMCNDSIDPRINGLMIKDIPLSNGKWAVIINIPLSLRRPHMAGLQKSFFIRRDDRSVPMTSDEIKGSVMEIVSLEKNLAEYKKMVEEELMMDYLGDHFGFVMHAIPLLLEEGAIDTKDSEIRNLLKDSSLEGNNHSLKSLSNPSPSLYGIVGQRSPQRHRFQTYIHSNGYVGFVFDHKASLGSLEDKKNKVIFKEDLEIFLIFIRLVRLVTDKSKLGTPYRIHCELKNANGSRYFIFSPSLANPRTSRIWQRSEIKLPPIRVDSFEKPEEIANYFSEKLRNAFGVE